MATLSEIGGLVNDPTLQDKVAGALLKQASAISVEDAGTANHANRLKYAKKLLTDPAGEKIKVMRYVVGANAAFTVAQITGASDATIETAVAGAINVFADGA